MTMKCPECGKIYMDEDMYCSICGTKLVEKKVGYARMSLFGGYNNYESGNNKRRRRSLFG